jgi:hypothetical protein
MMSQLIANNPNPARIRVVLMMRLISDVSLIGRATYKRAIRILYP